MDDKQFIASAPLFEKLSNAELQQLLELTAHNGFQVLCDSVLKIRQDELVKQQFEVRPSAMDGNFSHMDATLIGNRRGQWALAEIVRNMNATILEMQKRRAKRAAAE